MIHRHIFNVFCYDDVLDDWLLDLCKSIDLLLSLSWKRLFLTLLIVVLFFLIIQINHIINLEARLGRFRLCLWLGFSPSLLFLTFLLLLLISWKIIWFLKFNWLVLILWSWYNGLVFYFASRSSSDSCRCFGSVVFGRTVAFWSFELFLLVLWKRINRTLIWNYRG